MPNNWTFEAVPDVFVDLPSVQSQSPDNKVTTQPSFGLLSRDYPTDDAGAAKDADGASRDKQWTRFVAYVKSLNRDAPEGVAYKVLFLTRHGFGIHNKKHAEVGTAEWDRYWSLLDGDEHESWFDAYLTEQGIAQADELGQHWLANMAQHGTPFPDAVYTSPMTRCLQTTRHMLTPPTAALGIPLRPLVKELLRETYTLHTCDMRRSRTWIAEHFPECAFEDGFAEEDPFRAAAGGRSVAETQEEHTQRKHAALEQIFEARDSDGGGAAAGSDVVVSLTVHAGAIRAIVDACGAKTFAIREGSTVAMLVKGERKL